MGRDLRRYLTALREIGNHHGGSDESAERLARPLPGLEGSPCPQPRSVKYARWFRPSAFGLEDSVRRGARFRQSRRCAHPRVPGQPEGNAGDGPAGLEEPSSPRVRADRWATDRSREARRGRGGRGDQSPPAEMASPRDRRRRGRARIPHWRSALLGARNSPHRRLRRPRFVAGATSLMARPPLVQRPHR
jgi:hypothetical protein